MGEVCWCCSGIGFGAVGDGMHDEQLCACGGGMCMELQAEFRDEPAESAAGVKSESSDWLESSDVVDRVGLS